MFAQFHENSQILVNSQGDMMIREDDKLLIVGTDTKLRDLEGKA